MTGTAVLLLTATFHVLADATDDVTHSGALTLTALEFLNQGSYRFVENAVAQIHDSRDGAQTSGQLTIEQIQTNQLVHTDTVDIVNTAALSGNAVQQSVDYDDVYRSTHSHDSGRACRLNPTRHCA